ncbi:MAG: hypothetical protein U0234_14085 [Sandaracinus sp.]
MTTSIRVAILDEQIPAQLRERPADAEGLEVVWSGSSLDELLRFTARQAPQVIVASLSKLGPDPVAAGDRLLAASGAELLVTVYDYASRATVEHLAGERRRVVRAPVSIPMLKTQMMSAIVRGLLAEPSSARGGSSRPPQIRGGGDGALPDAPLYTDAQLGTLRERSSRLACECPNHVAELVTSLLAFERYSRACASRDEDDAAQHRALAAATARARQVMEAALTDLLRFEGITV